MNEFREQLNSQATKFVTRSEHDLLIADIQDLKETRAMLSGKASQLSVTITMILAFSGLLVSILALVAFMLVG